MKLAKGFIRFGGFALGNDYENQANPKYGAYADKNDFRTKDGEPLTLQNLFKVHEITQEAGERKIYSRGRQVIIESRRRL